MKPSFFLSTFLIFFLLTTTSQAATSKHKIHCQEPTSFFSFPVKGKKLPKDIKTSKDFWRVCHLKWQKQYGTLDRKKWVCKKKKKCHFNEKFACGTKTTTEGICQTVKYLNKKIREKARAKAEKDAGVVRYCRYHASELCRRLRKPAYFKCVKRVSWSRNYNWKKKQCKPYYDKVQDCIREVKLKTRRGKSRWEKGSYKMTYDRSDKRVAKFYNKCIKKRAAAILKKNPPKLKHCYKYTQEKYKKCKGWSGNRKLRFLTHSICFQYVYHTCYKKCDSCVASGPRRKIKFIP